MQKLELAGRGQVFTTSPFEGFSKVVALKLRKLRREDFQIATRIREVRLGTAFAGRGPVGI